MAPSRKPRANSGDMSDSLLRASLEQALSKVPLGQLPPGQVPPGEGIAVALSGGPDSSALAVCASHWARQHNRRLHLLHVHHGLLAQADQWTETVKQLASLLDCPLDVRQVTVDLTSGHGVEGAARNARYAAIESMASEHKIGVVLLAHHQQDQAETVLMRLLRGAGVSGLAAMATLRRSGELYWVRPWLDVPRQAILDELAAFSAQTGWLPVDDPSNTDGNLARGALRSKVIPAIQTHWPAWQQTLARHAQQSAQADRLLLRYGQQLLGQIQTHAGTRWPTLSLAHWRKLDPDEQALVIRVWLRLAGVQMPTDKRLAELVRQLSQVHALGHDRALKWSQRDCTISCIRGQLHLDVKIEGFEGESGGADVKR